MEDFYYAGGLPAVLRELGENGALDRDALTVNGQAHLEECRGSALLEPRCDSHLRRSIQGKRRHRRPARQSSSRWRRDQTLRRDPNLLQHRGRAVVFSSIEDFYARIDQEDLDIDETCVMVLQNCGPRGYPGMAEVGNMPLPPKILRKGVTDMVRISDARMSGTAYGTVVLHASPEAAAGGPLALVRSGDMITLDVPGARSVWKWTTPRSPPAAPNGRRRQFPSAAT